MQTLLNGRVYIPKCAEKCGTGQSKGDEWTYTSEEEVKEEPSPQESATAPVGKKRAIARRVHKANVNVISINYQQLISAPSQMLVGPPLTCATCEAFCSHISKPTADGKSWRCAFCRKLNDIVPGDVRAYLTNESVSYLMPDKVDVVPENDIRILFVVDKSGSMGITIPEAGFKTPLGMLTEFIQAKLKKLVTTNPKSKVGLIFFNDAITIVGDACHSAPRIHNRDILNDKTQLKKAIVSLTNTLLEFPLEISLERLLSELNPDETANQTALGPAMVTGLELLRGGNPGSRMYVFTDGIANIGVGNLDSEEGKVPTDEQLYKEITTEARELAIEVSIFKLAQQPCRMEVFAQLTKETYGQLMEISPEQIAEEVVLPDVKELLARQGEMRLRLPSYLKFRLVLEKGILKAPNLVVKKHGRFVLETKDQYQFVVDAAGYVKSKEEIKKTAKAPCQVSLKYINKDNKCYVVVLSKELSIIREKTGSIDCSVLRNYIGDLRRNVACEHRLPEAQRELESVIGLLHLAAGADDPHKEHLVKNAQEIQEEMKLLSAPGKAAGTVRETMALPRLPIRFPATTPFPKPAPHKPRSSSPPH